MVRTQRFQSLQQPKKASVQSTLFRRNRGFQHLSSTNHTACFKKHLKVDHPCRKHMYYLMVHDNAAFQFVETHLNQCWGLSHPGDTGEGILDGARSFPALPEINFPLPNALIFSWYPSAYKKKSVWLLKDNGWSTFVLLKDKFSL